MLQQLFTCAHNVGVTTRVMHAAAAQRMANIAQGVPAVVLQILRKSILGGSQRLFSRRGKH
ncbi:MAG TPA: hypothetical protein VGG26_03470, partial [Terracidiphilus sp.]